MKRFFKCKFVRNDEMVVAVETSETGDIANRVEIPHEVGDSFFGREEWGNMIFDDLAEITEQEALDWTFSGRLDDIPMAILAEDEQPQSEAHNSDGILVTEAEADFLEGDKNIEEDAVEIDAEAEAMKHRKHEVGMTRYVIRRRGLVQGNEVWCTWVLECEATIPKDQIYAILEETYDFPGDVYTDRDDSYTGQEIERARNWNEVIEGVPLIRMERASNGYALKYEGVPAAHADNLDESDIIHPEPHIDGTVLSEADFLEELKKMEDNP